MVLNQAAVDENGGEVTRDELPVVNGDYAQLCQLLQNLVGNAIKYRGDEAPHVSVRSEEKDEGWIITVRDNGIGVLPKYFERIFEVVRRLHTQEEYRATASDWPSAGASSIGTAAKYG